MGEPEKGEGFRPLIATGLSGLGGETPEIDQPRLLLVELQAEPSQPVRLGAYAAFKRDCSGGTAADRRPAGDQRGGVLMVSAGTLSTARVPGCTTVTSPARIIAFRPNLGFTGTHRVTFDVVDSATGGSETHSVSITVAP